MAKYSIGLDFGTLSGRALLVNVQTGEELASAVYDYPHAVMDTAIPCGKKLKADWALQHPQDYLDVVTQDVPAMDLDMGGMGDSFDENALLMMLLLCSQPLR